MSACFLLAFGSIELYFYGELDGSARADVERHLASCEACRQALGELQTIRDALASRPDVSAPPSGAWRGFMTRLDDAIGRQPPVVPAGLARPSASSRVGHHYASYIAVAALLALVTTSVAYVVRSRPALVGDSDIPPIDAATMPIAGDPPARPWDADAAFASLSEQHFERSKLVVLGLASKDAQDAGAVEWEYERELATTLLSDTRLYRLAAEERGMTSLAKVMGDLELVLLQTAMSSDPEPATLQQIQGLIRKRDLVTKMNVVAVNGM